MRHCPTLSSILLVVLTACTCSCERLLMEDDMEATPRTTFEYLWKKVDEQYAFFDVKQVDWKAVHDSTAPHINDKMGKEALFARLSTMLNTLDDGHVNLISSFDVSHCPSIYQRMQEGHNYNSDLITEHYLGYDYHTTGGLRYTGLHHDSILYVRYSSFSGSASVSQIAYVTQRYARAQGMIVDVRQNGGGEVQNVWNWLTMLPTHGELLYTTQIKRGRDHEDFSTPQAVYAPPNNTTYKPYAKPVVVLIDRGSFSATSFFALSLRSLSSAVLIGDTTAGGLGLPNGGQLPNGWYYRFSITRTLSPEGENFENGVPPDEVVHLDATQAALGIDNIIERACSIIYNKASL